jgi:NAD(P)-dependent dehydrogenase (short-subunit alcohol dehydrogenase family)
MKSDGYGRLAQRTALVTGAGSPVGRAVCERFAREGAWIVAVDGRQETAEGAAQLARDTGAPAIGLKTAALDPTITGTIVNTALQRMWQIDILVNNTTPIADDASVGGVDWAGTMAINLEASYRFIQGVVPRMRARGTGVVLTVGWCWGDSGEAAEALARETSEAAVMRLTQRVATEHGPAGVRAWTICPVAAGAADDERPEPGGVLRLDRDTGAEQVAGWLTRLAAERAEAAA